MALNFYAKENITLLNLGILLLLTGNRFSIYMIINIEFFRHPCIPI